MHSLVSLTRDDDRETFTTQYTARHERSPMSGITAIIPISGVIAKYSRMVNGTSQPRGTSVEQIHSDLAVAVADANVTRIVLHIESPGGSISGLADLADEIYNAREEKQIVAVIDDIGASAAYWLASQAEAVYCNQTAAVGSIGVYTLLLDDSKWAQNKGYKFHLIKSGEHKGVGAEGIEITDEQLEKLQGRIDAYFSAFKTAVLRGRAENGKLTAEQLDEVADGQVFIGSKAVNLGLADGIATLGEVLDGTADENNNRTQSRADGTARNFSTSLNHNDNNEGDFSMTPTTPMTTKKEQAQGTPPLDADQAAEAARTEGATAERERISLIDSNIVGASFAEVRQKAINAGWGLDKAKAEAFDVSLTVIEDLQGKLTATNDRLAKAFEGGIDALENEVSDDQVEAQATAKKAAEKADGAKAFEAKVDEFVANGMTRDKAIVKVSREHTTLHAAWLEKVNI